MDIEFIDRRDEKIVTCFNTPVTPSMKEALDKIKSKRDLHEMTRNFFLKIIEAENKKDKAG